MAKSKKTPLPPIDGLLPRAEAFAREEPSKAVVAAFGAGFLLNFLPLSAITAALVGIAFSLVRPALLFCGLLKAYEFLRTQNPTPDLHE